LRYENRARRIAAGSLRLHAPRGLLNQAWVNYKFA
jgi:hypothetical protein